MTQEQQEVYKLIENHYRKRYNRLVQVADKTVRNHADAEEVVQEAFTRACQYWNTYVSDQSKFNTWFDAIFINCIRDKKKEIRLQGQTDTYNQHKDKRSVINPAIEHLQLSEINEKMSHLKPHMQIILSLHLLRGYDISDIERIVPESYKNIEQIVQRFKKDLRCDKNISM